MPSVSKTKKKVAKKKVAKKKVAKKKVAKKKVARKAKTAAPSSGGDKVVLLSGGNPQIAKADGDAPVQAYIAAMPGWKGDVGRRLDTLITKTLPKVRKAVRWNTPFYGVEGKGWFLGYHCLTKYVKVSFHNGTMLTPVPPVGSKVPNVRYLHVFEDGAFDDKQFVQWVRQASTLPGEALF